MKKRIICGSVAILLTGLTGAMFTTAAPHAREATHVVAAAPIVNTPVYAPSLDVAGNAAPSYRPASKESAPALVSFPG